LLVVEDEPGAVEQVRTSLVDLLSEIRISAVSSAAALEAVAEVRPRLILLDLVRGTSGVDLMQRLHAVEPGADIILITHHASTELAVEAIQKGAYDYLTKPLPSDQLKQKVKDWLWQTRTRDQAADLETRLAEVIEFEGIIGRSRASLELFSRIERVAPHYSNLLIQGETGTGKELVARVLHRLSPCADGPFVVCNCAAITETLFESELFGHVRGAFTGAVSDRTGLIEHAKGGTLFLDEIGEVPLPVQAKLLRVLQSREILKLGSPSVECVDVRIITATNRDLARMVADRTFREDLYYRLSMVQLKTSRLADRREDVPLLVQHFLMSLAQRYRKGGLQLSRRARVLLGRYSWPGNVRELESALTYAAMMCEGDVLDVEDFPEEIRHHPSAKTSASSDTEILPLAEMERRYVLQVLEKVGNNQSRAAGLLQIGRTKIWRILSSKRQDEKG
jgi:DNA-binding NtrC family response regulator